MAMWKQSHWGIALTLKPDLRQRGLCPPGGHSYTFLYIRVYGHCWTKHAVRDHKKRGVPFLLLQKSGDTACPRSLDHKEMAESLYATFLTGQMQSLTSVSVFSCCTTNQHKHSGFQQHPFIRSLLCRSEVWHGVARISAQGTTPLKSTYWPGWVLVWRI